MDQVLANCLPGQWLYPHELVVPSALSIRPTGGIAEKYRRLHRRAAAINTLRDRDARCNGCRLNFERPTKFFTIVRHPVDRVISSFYHNRTESHLISYPFIKDLSLEQFLDSGIRLDADDRQVRC